MICLQKIASNVFIVEDNNIITPKLSENLLPGVTKFDYKSWRQQTSFEEYFSNRL